MVTLGRATPRPSIRGFELLHIRCLSRTPRSGRDGLDPLVRPLRSLFQCSPIGRSPRYTERDAQRPYFRRPADLEFAMASGGNGSNAKAFIPNGSPASVITTRQLRDSSTELGFGCTEHRSARRRRPVAREGLALVARTLPRSDRSGVGFRASAHLLT